jgi:hypothetical protein
MKNEVALASALAMQQAWERTITPALQQAAVNGDQWLSEVIATARLAAADGDYNAAFKGYELAAKKLGFLQQDQTVINIAFAPDEVLAARARLEKEVEFRTITEETPEPTW